jgi:hypothetical protein
VDKENVAYIPSGVLFIKKSRIMSFAGKSGWNQRMIYSVKLKKTNITYFCLYAESRPKIIKITIIIGL